MALLTRRALSTSLEAVAHADPAPRPVKILQIGDGVFLRGFVDWMIDVANEKGIFDGGVAIAKARPGGLGHQLEAQETLYTVLLRGRVDGREAIDRRIVSTVQLALDPHTQWRRFLEIGAGRDLRFVVSNTTEAGIVDVEEPFDPDVCPESFPAKVAALLWARWSTLGPDAPGLVVLPCELIEANGATLRRVVLGHARRWGLDPAFVAWIEGKTVFLDTLVDRIVPGFPGAEKEALFREWGYEDPLAVAAEPFHVWVIEGPKAIAAELPLAEAGLDVVWTDDLRPYRARKVRLLNGGHTSTVLAAFLAGLDTVEAITRDAQMSAFLRRMLFDEIAPRIRLPDVERRAYAATVLERFANPFLRHELISIALNSVSKWVVRVLPTVEDWVAEGEPVPQGLAFSLAALLAFYRGERQADGVYGRRERGPYPIRDDARALDLMTAAWAGAAPGDAPAVARRLLADTRLWGKDLTTVGDLAAKVETAIAAIEDLGVRGALDHLSLASPSRAEPPPGSAARG
ncbi:tagaturonate reductase [Roseiarcus fermentans]|uniref:Tagaturonate reductase n=1 Tax=Roseiarcus fermentans TaxID=1473586 RepID=A0A366FIS1_9HYPH|nr:tagaturonate reductase [Roseiarcus fermentans]RBP13880.1 tagaturonate reductase [Roseiarcus fermentans]